MSHRPFPPTTLWSTLSLLDRRSADEVRRLGCTHCGERLHLARYPRKPRGVERSVLGEAYTRRESFCCASCRKRTTPPSLRFLGRKVYLGALLVLFGNLGGTVAPTPSLLRAAAASTGVPARTLERWHRWWSVTIPATRWWRELRSAFMPPVDGATLPIALLDRVEGEDEPRRLTRVLALAGPLSTRTCSHFPRVPVHAHEMV